MRGLIVHFVRQRNKPVTIDDLYEFFRQKIPRDIIFWQVANLSLDDNPPIVVYYANSEPADPKKLDVRYMCTYTIVAAVKEEISQ